MVRSNEKWVLNPRNIPLCNFFYTLEKEKIERLILLLLHGVLHTLKEKKTSIESAESIIFNLDILNFCQKYAIDTQIIELIEYGMELGDIVELVKKPNALDEAIEECLKTLHEISIGPDQ